MGGAIAEGPACRRSGVLVAAALLAMAASPAAAAADTFFAAPGASDAAACTQADPCELEHAIEVVAQDGDTVQAAAGTYSGAEVGEGTSGVEVLNGVTLEGDGAADTTTIESSEFAGVVLDHSDALVRDIRIEVTNADGPLALVIFAGRAERVFARATLVGDEGEGSFGCVLFPTTMLRDSVCRGRSTGAGGPVFVLGAVGLQFSDEFGIRLVGVTAVGDVAGLAGFGESGESAPILASNTIAEGDDVDVGSLGDGPIVLDHSNYSTTSGANVTPAGTGTNQTAEPLFVDGANDDFREAPGSPTIDAGDSSSPDIGSQDIAGQPRVQGAAVDIGAFELAAGPCQTPLGDPQNHLNSISYETSVLLAGPVAYWRLGEPSGPTAFDSADGFDGTYTGTITLGVPGAIAFDPNTAADFSPDVKSRVPTTLPHKAFNSNSVRTFEGWACREENRGFDVFFSGDRRFNSPGMWTDHGDLDRIWFDPRREGGTAPRFWDGVMPPDGEWFHWVLVFNDPANTAELFIDGASQGVRSVTEPYHSTPGSFQIGNYGQINEAWNGPLDEIAVYDRALTLEEIAEHHFRGSGQAPE